MSADALISLLSGLIGVILTLLVLSRLFGDNPAFRIVQYLFIGSSLGYALVVLYHQVLRPGLFGLLASLNDPFGFSVQLIPWLIGLLLLARITGRQAVSWLANLPLAILFGVGTALAVGGALLGTLVPQMLATVQPMGTTPLELAGAVLLVLGVICTLCYFYFTVPRTTPVGRVVALGAVVGRWLLMIAFGFFLAGGLITYLTALNGRLEFILGWLRAPLG